VESFGCWLTATCTCLAVVSISENAALVERLGGLAYYDDDADLTWLADANYAYTSGYHPDGLFSPFSANTWAAQLDVAGVTGWRLSESLQPDSSCDIQSGYGSSGYNCTGSEMGNLYYNVLGNAAGSLSSTGPFSNVVYDQSFYWTSTTHLPHDGSTWAFGMFTGYQQTVDNDNRLIAWAVHDGDVGVVPIPSAVWLFGSGLIGLIGLARRKKA